MARFHLTEAARSSLVAIGRYTEQVWGREQRNTYLRALDRQFDDLAARPMKGRPRDELWAGLRSCQEGKHVIYYLVRGQDVVIVDVLRECMDPAYSLKRHGAAGMP